MKDALFEAKIIAARPARYKNSAVFTDNVMHAIDLSEIKTSPARIMSVDKKETLFMKLRLLPKFAIVMIAIGTLLALSGTAYAAYQLLWPKPDVQVSQPSISVSGRKEFEISLAQCGDQGLATRYELKSNATITVDEVPMVVKAQCELQAIQTWAQATYPHDNMRQQPPTGQAYDSTTVSTSMATHIKSRNATAIVFEGLSGYNESDLTFTIPQTIRYIADGKLVEADSITTSDPVAYVTSTKSHMVPSGGCTKQNCGYGSSSWKTTLLAVVKLSGDFKDYDQFAWQSLTERQACIGNPSESCLSGNIGAIDVYQAEPVPANGEIMKEVQGVITDINGKTIAIRASSGAMFTITTPTDAVSTYNTNKAARYYNNQTIKPGSSLIIRYFENSSLHSKHLSSDALMSIQLQIEMVGKGDAIRSY